MAKHAALLLIAFLAASSMIMVESSLAQSIPKPSVPEFTLKYVDYSYDVPPTYGIDPYSGQNVTIQAGYHVHNRTIELTIKNQAFTSYNDSSGNYIGLYYNFRYRGLYGIEWSYYPFQPNGRSTIPYNGASWGTGDLSPKYPASSSDYTKVSLPLGVLGVPTGYEVEVEVQALIGHIDIEVTGLMAGDWYTFIGEPSGWSNPQTLTIGESQTPTPSPATTPTPTSSPPPTPYSGGRLTEQEIIIGVAIAATVIIVGLGLLIYLIKRK